MSVLLSDFGVATGPRQTITATVSVEGLESPINLNFKKDPQESMATFLCRVAQRCEWLGNEMDKRESRGNSRQ